MGWPTLVCAILSLLEQVSMYLPGMGLARPGESLPVEHISSAEWHLLMHFDPRYLLSPNQAPVHCYLQTFIDPGVLVK